MNQVKFSFRSFVLTVFFSCIFSLVFLTPSFANNLSITNVSLEDRNVSSGSVVVEFDVSWNNSWRTKINHDALWLTVRLYNPSGSPADKKLCQLTASGLNPFGTSVNSDSGLEVYVPTDKMGAFVRPSAFGVNGTIEATDVNLTVDFNSCGFDSSDEVYASILGIEMVYVPEGAFYAGDNSVSTSSLHEGSADTEPWYIDGASAISVTDSVSNGYRYVSASNSGEDLDGASFAIAASFPKGYSPFYVMKYEISEGLWVEFLNSLPSAGARSQRDLTNSTHKNSDTVQYRNTISCSGSLLTCSTSRPFRAVNYLSWMDLAAFLDWAGLRPMTELEYEKVSRGPLLPVPGEFAWGSTDIVALTELSAGDEDGMETVVTPLANAHYGNSILSGGDSINGADYQQGPTRMGTFANTDSTRVTSGGSYYGVMELSGNLSERTVTIGNSIGRGFKGTHGDGVLSSASGYEGNATNTDWPGIDAVNSRGVTGAVGSGFRGGSWSDIEGALRISDRTNAANAVAQALNNSGGRGVRTYDE